ncbi:hypothetical protein SISSUDRAFT_1056590 [Sistotremastrum suecicum HHB10207 ss-3]|uniref:Uncharacterized protein n=1 Tax=Sistotremastrum suecicum HHB10207 ss-3 TaxID=1314776 RepID=A0A165WJ24_9AGAM|nr:hypothetical protein SISSUDRAFT_1056590 [Sistotremastrum suecicum HHB10207 ss-3]
MKNTSSLEATGPDATDLLHSLKTEPALGNALVSLKVWDFGASLHVPQSSTPEAIARARQHQISLQMTCLSSFFWAHQGKADARVPGVEPLLIGAARYNDEDVFCIHPPARNLAADELKADVLFQSELSERRLVPQRIDNSWWDRCSGLTVANPV